MGRVVTRHKYFIGDLSKSCWNYFEARSIEHSASNKTFVVLKCFACTANLPMNTAVAGGLV